MPTVPANSIGIKPAFITNNRSYKYPKYVTKKAAMLHSTATPGAIAETFTKKWNSNDAECSTEFIIDDKNIFMMMPIGKNGVKCMKSWHCAGAANSTHVACELCEPIEAQMLPVNFYTQGEGVKYPRKYATTRIQMELVALGFLPKDEIDGYFGPKTTAAVKAFQKKNGIDADGLVGRTTLRILQNRKGSYAAYDVVSATPFFNAVYDNAVKLYGFICNYIGCHPSDIICHSEGYSRGIASNHADVMHWFPAHGKSMNTFRNDVSKWINGTYVPMNGSTVNTPETFYKENVHKMVRAGIINTPDYWINVIDEKDVKNNYVMALLRQAGAYFCGRSYVYGAEALEHACNIDAKWWAKTQCKCTTSDVRDLYRSIAKGITGKTMNFDEAITECLSAGIINSPEYWINLKLDQTPSPNCVAALLRQAGAYYCGRSYIYAIDCLEDVINLADVQYWRNGSYTVDNVVEMVNAIAKCID